MSMGELVRRTEQLKDYLKRLNGGEDMEKVRADFAKNFRDVAASEIMKAEQELLAEGMPLTQVQRLCDVHSALFHGATCEEKAAATPEDYRNKRERAGELTRMPGHPLHTFTRENEELLLRIRRIKQAMNEGVDCGEALGQIKEVATHYAKKGDLLYPHLKVWYGVSGPSDVMWTVDDEIRDELSAQMKESNHDEKWIQRVDAVLKRIEEMIYKEENILFPVCAVNFTEKDWKEIYRDSKDYGTCFGVQPKVWEEAEAEENPEGVTCGDEIIMPGGHMTLEQLTALLNTIPMEITFIDKENRNCYFNEGHKVFKRPSMAIDRDVFSCHPPKIEPMVRSIISDFQNNRKDQVQVWMEKEGATMLVNYMAVRDKDKNYLGTVELVWNMEFAKKHFMNKD